MEYNCSMMGIRLEYNWSIMFYKLYYIKGENIKGEERG